MNEKNLQNSKNKRRKMNNEINKELKKQNK